MVKLMNGNDLVSVIVAVYNIEQYLDRCIESIIRQKYEFLDIILVDDGSKDKCPEICDEWRKRDSRIQVIHQENRGLSAARNTGIDNAKGRYVVFVDGDDYLEDEYVETLYHLINENNATMSVCNFYFVRENERENSKKEANIPNWRGTGRELLLLEAKRRIFLGPAWCKMYNVNQFKKLRFLEGKIHEDEFFFHEIMWEVDEAICTRRPLYNYLQRKNSIIHSKMTEKKLLDGIDAKKKRVLFYQEKEANDLWEIAIWNYVGAIKNAFLTYGDIMHNSNKKILLADLYRAMYSIWRGEKCSLVRVIKEEIFVLILWLKQIHGRKS